MLRTTAFTGLWCSLFLTFSPSHGAELDFTITKKAAESSMTDALELLGKAKTKLATIKDYQCLYLRDENIDGNLKQNVIRLSVRKDPFSVLMHWPSTNRRVGYKSHVSNLMVVRDPNRTFGFAVSVDPKRSIQEKESRHTIVSAGLHNMIDRLEERWKQEKTLDLSTVEVREIDLVVKNGNDSHKHRCIQIITTHPVKHREKFEEEGFRFFMTYVAFDKDTGLPVQMKGYDWPANNKDSVLLENFVYVDVRPNLGLQDQSFTP